MTRKTLFLFLLNMIIFHLNSNAQSGTASLSGTVLEQGDKPADAATVLLVKASDSSIQKMTLADEKGNFIFENIVPENYRIWITLIGHKDYKSDNIALADKPVQFSTVKLESDGAQLQEVNVTSRKAYIERKADRTVVNVDALISNAGTSALEVLEKSPGVRVDQNGSISLKGKDGVMVLIDNKPTYLSGTDLQNYLRALPSSSLEQIEIMTNPPAMYDAAGSAGVINIKTKRNKNNGLNGNLSLSYNQGKYVRSNNSVNLTYRTGKINAFATIGYTLHNSFNDLDINRRYKNTDESTQSYFEQNTYIKNTANFINVKTGLEFNQNEKTTWGIQLNGQLRSGNQSNDNTSNILNASKQLDSSIIALNKEKSNFKNGGVNLNYRHQFNKNGRELTVDADYIAYQDHNNQVFDNTSYLPNGTISLKDRLDGSLPAHIDIYSIKSDYVHPLEKGYVLSTGVKASYIKTDNLAAYDYTANNITAPDYDKSNNFIYKENISAAYLNLSKDFKRLSVQAGLRAEHTNSDGHQLGNVMKPDSAFTRSYTSLFPTFFLSYKVDSAGNHQFGLNYGRRINRPYYQDLNPFISPLDKFTYYVGNPFLKPAFTNSVELSYTYHNRITATLSYGNRSDEVNETIEIKDGTYYSRPGNIGKVIVKTLSVDANFEPASWLEFHCYTEVSNIHSISDFYSGKLNTEGTYWFIQPIFQFKLGKGFTAELIGRYITDVTNAQFISGANGSINTGLQKTLGKRTTLKLGVNDIFYTAINKGIINNLANTEASYNNRFDSRQFVFTFNYRFGGANGTARKHNGTGAESETERVKN
jgi:hypothetical protein